MHVKPNAVLLGEGSTVVATGIIFYVTFGGGYLHVKLDDAARRVFVRIWGWPETPNKQKLRMIFILCMMVTSEHDKIILASEWFGDSLGFAFAEPISTRFY